VLNSGGMCVTMHEANVGFSAAPESHSLVLCFRINAELDIVKHHYPPTATSVALSLDVFHAPSDILICSFKVFGIFHFRDL